jgi:hypothetical protein
MNVKFYFGGNGDKSVGYFVQPTIILYKKSIFYYHARRNFWPRNDNLRLR